MLNFRNCKRLLFCIIGLSVGYYFVIYSPDQINRQVVQNEGLPINQSTLGASGVDDAGAMTNLALLSTAWILLYLRRSKHKFIIGEEVSTEDGPLADEVFILMGL